MYMRIQVSGAVDRNGEKEEKAVTIPRPEHPQPQMRRDNWMNLNGEWDFAFDFGNSGIDRKLCENEKLDRKILVPFCPESELSGIGCKDFMRAVWYHRTVSLTDEQTKGRLYDLELRFGDDLVHSYFGMREVRIDGERVLLNGKSVFQRLVLDQGFYPDGIYTAPTEEALIQDIRLSMDAGFNGARLHQKVFEPLFLYHCDRLGYLVWGEHANWGLDISAPEGLKHFLPEWMEAVCRDFNHPAIVGWCPFNETWDCRGRKQDDELLAVVYRMTKLADITRPCIDTSGNYHVESDIFDLHDYTQDPKEFAAHYAEFAAGGKPFDPLAGRQQFIEGVPVFISEFGGIKWDVEGVNGKGWGYGDSPKTEKEFLDRYRGLVDALLDHPRMFGFCYTQLYDVEQEMNGLYTYSRKPKFDMKVIRAINSRKAAVEE